MIEEKEPYFIKRTAKISVPHRNGRITFIHRNGQSDAPSSSVVDPGWWNEELKVRVPSMGELVSLLHQVYTKDGGEGEFKDIKRCVEEGGVWGFTDVYDFPKDSVRFYYDRDVPGTEGRELIRLFQEIDSCSWNGWIGSYNLSSHHKKYLEEMLGCREEREVVFSDDGFLRMVRGDSVKDLDLDKTKLSEVPDMIGLTGSLEGADKLEEISCVFGGTPYLPLQSSEKYSTKVGTSFIMSMYGGREQNNRLHIGASSGSKCYGFGIERNTSWEALLFPGIKEMKWSHLVSEDYKENWEKGNGRR